MTDTEAGELIHIAKEYLGAIERGAPFEEMAALIRSSRK
jgi:hypothetical protein